MSVKAKAPKAPKAPKSPKKQAKPRRKPLPHKKSGPQPGAPNAGRPRTVITDDDLALIKAKAMTGCTLQDIAWSLGITEETLVSAMQRTYSVQKAVHTGRAQARESIMSRQLQTAFSNGHYDKSGRWIPPHPGAAAMQIHLGKVRCGQSDRIKVEIVDEASAMDKLRSLYPDAPEEFLRVLAGQDDDVQALAEPEQSGAEG